MIGTSPLSLERDEFCFMWWKKGKHPESTERIWVVKFDRDGRVMGKWDRDWIENMEPAESLFNFVKNSYLISYQGKNGIFSRINEILESNFFESLDSRYLIDVEEFLGWIDDEILVNRVLGQLHEICSVSLELESKTHLLKEWFIANLYPIFKHGVN